MSDETDEPVERTNPTKDQPLNARPRPRLSPLLWLLGLVVVLALLYYLGVTFLIPAG